MAPRPKLRLDLKHCRFSVHANDPETLPSILDYYKILRSYIEHEDSLINSRLTWSLTVHGFLFATYGILLGKIADILMELHRWAELHLPDLLHTSATPARLERIILYLVAAQIPVALFGAAVGLQSQQAIYAAHRALVHLESIAHEGIFPINPPTKVPPAGSILLPNLTSGGAAHHSGPRSYYLNLPRGAMVIWLLLLILSVAFLAVHNWLFSIYLS